MRVRLIKVDGGNNTEDKESHMQTGMMRAPTHKIGMRKTLRHGGHGEAMPVPSGR